MATSSLLWKRLQKVLIWLVMIAIIWLLLMQKVDVPQVPGVLLISSIAGLIIHITAGIGMLEALLRGEPISHGAIIAALLAMVLYLWLEGRAKNLAG